MSQVDLPLEKVIDVCNDDFFVMPTRLRENLTLAAYDSFYIFDQVTYRQFDVLAMVSPLGPILAIKCLCHFEKQWLSACAPDILTKDMLTKDDIFLMSLCQSHLNDLVIYVNTKHQSITFTSKFEKNDSF